jgi:hypothetical protein
MCRAVGLGWDCCDALRDGRGTLTRLVFGPLMAGGLSVVVLLIGSFFDFGLIWFISA